MTTKMKISALSAMFLIGLILPSFVSADTIADLQAQIASLLAQIKTLQEQLARQMGEEPVQWCHDFNVGLKYGSSGKEVIALHQALEKEGFGPFERGGDDINVFDQFTEETASAVTGFQQKYKKEILDPWNLQYGTGFVGKTTRAKLNQFYGCGSGTIPEPCPANCVCSGEVTTCSIEPIPIETNLPPVITGVSGPTNVDVYQAANWTIKAYDPDGTYLSYSVDWGDIVAYEQGVSSSAKPQTTSQSASFSHTYTAAGAYTVKFTVTDNKGASAGSAITVQVGNVIPQTGHMKVTVIDRNVMCVCASNAKCSPCGVIYKAEVSVYDEKGNFVRKEDTSGGAAVFYDLPVGVYTARADASGYTSAKSEFKIYPGTSGYLTIYLERATVQPSITVLSPNGGEVWAKGSVQTIKWSQSGCNYVMADLNSTATWQISAGNSAKTEQFTWEIPTDIPTGNNYTIRLFCAEQFGVTTDVYDDSNAYFSIAAATPSITVLSPNGWEKWEIGKTYEIKWQGGALNSMVDIYLYKWSTKTTTGTYSPTLVIASNTANDGSYTWTIPEKGEPDPEEYYIRVADRGSAGLDDSDAPFSIVAATTPINGSCGSANGQTFTSAPTTNLCSAGTATGVTPREKDGLVVGYAWACNGANGGYDVSCTAEKSITQPSITVLSPNGGESFSNNQIIPISVQIKSGKSGTIKIWLIDEATSDIFDVGTVSINPANINYIYKVDLDLPQLKQMGYSVPAASTKYRAVSEWKSSDGTEFLQDGSNNQFSIAAAACTDSDGGKNYYYVKGKTYGTIYAQGATTKTWEDFCSTEDVVQEYSCRTPSSSNLSDVEITYYNCLNGCSNGACVILTESTCGPAGVKRCSPVYNAYDWCTDTDGNGSNEWALKEYCGDNETCSNGACIGVTSQNIQTNQMANILNSAQEKLKEMLEFLKSL